MVAEGQGSLAGAAFSAVDGDEVDAAAGAVSCLRRELCPRSVTLPTADLMPTGRPVRSASISTKSSMLSTSENALWRDGLRQSRAELDAACRGDLWRDLRGREHAAETWLGALAELDLDRPHRVFERTESASSAQVENAPSPSRQPK